MNALRIGWAAPWNTSSAIAQSAAEVAFELASRGHAVTVLRTETAPFLDYPQREAPGSVLRLSQCPTDELMRDFDVIVGHFGDHHGFHGALLPRLADLGVVGIMHDACIPHLLSDFVNNDEAAFRRLVLDTYGDGAVAEGAPLWTDLSEIARRRPMLEWVARRTVGAIAHAEHYAARLRDACPGPVAVVPLAFSVPDLPPPPASWRQMTISVVGHANANKRIDQVIMAVGASYLLRERCRLRIIGQATEAERERLMNLARALEVAPPDFLGWVDDEELAYRLRDVDVMSCLRNPVLEGASASLVLALASGRPTLITGHGCYAEVPPDAALVCSPASEALDVMRHLERLVATPDLGAAVGKRAQAFVQDRHTAANYCDVLLPLLEEVVSRRPLNLAQRQMNRTLAEFDLSADSPAARRIGAVLSGMVSATA